MSTLNSTLNGLFSTLNNAVAKAEGKRDRAVEKAKSDFAETERVAKEAFEAELVKVANEAFENGVTLEEFAQDYGKTLATTRNHLKDLGVAVPVSKRGVKSRYSEDEQVEIARQWKVADTRGRMELALEKNVTDATMRNWAIEHGVYAPKKREAKVEQETEVQATVNA